MASSFPFKINTSTSNTPALPTAPAIKIKPPGTVEEIIKELENGSMDFFKNQSGQPFVSFQDNGVTRTVQLSKESFCDVAIYIFYEKYSVVVQKHMMAQAIGILASKTHLRGRTEKSFVRVAGAGNEIYIDMSNKDGEAIKIDPAGWDIIKTPPVKFIQLDGQDAMPAPVRGGSVDLLKKVLNLQSEEDLVIVVAFMLKAFSPTGPYPILCINGEQGTAKSCLSRYIKMLCDPTFATNRACVATPQDLYIAASNAWILDYDNLSELSKKVQDAACQLSTGGSHGTRKLYSNSKEALLSGSRPIIFSGIPNLLNRNDMAERAITLKLKPIPEDKRMGEDELDAMYEELRPQILGALCDAVSCALRNKNSCLTKRLPRMADFAKFIIAAEDALPWPKGTFEKYYMGNQQKTIDMVLDEDNVALAVLSLMEGKYDLMDTPTNILLALEKQPCVANIKLHLDKSWPKSANKLKDALERSQTFLRSKGIEFDLNRTADGGHRMYYFVNESVIGSVLSDGIIDAQHSDQSIANSETNTSMPETSSNVVVEESLEDLIKRADEAGELYQSIFD